MTATQDDSNAEDIRRFSDEELRAYLAGHRSLFTVREVEFLDSIYEESKRSQQTKVTTTWTTS